MAEEMPATNLDGSVGIVERQYHTSRQPFVLENGATLPEITTCYEMYGSLNERGDNVILIQHGLTGSSHAAGRFQPDSKYAGYWDSLIGPGRAMDTDRYCVIAPNALGGCRGTTGPSSVDPRTGKPYGSRFPTITIRDMVRAQRPFLDALGVHRLRMVIGASMGGMQAIEWAVTYPEMVDGLCMVGSNARQTAQAIAFNHCMRRAILADPNWNGGDYYDGEPPKSGLAIARMIGHITYLCEERLEKQFDLRSLNPWPGDERSDYVRFEIEEYLDEEGRKLVHRFDANTYVCVSRAIDLHDVSRGRGSMEAALASIRARCLLIGIRTDFLFPPEGVRRLAGEMADAGVQTEYWEMDTRLGHDAFLEEQEKLAEPISRFLAGLENAECRR
jgi:homoserine O-acetyltransferase